MKPSINPVRLNAVKINGGFWGPRLETVRTRTIPHLHHFLKEIGYLDAWNLNWKEGQPKKPHIFWDSDVAKWMEAAAYSLTWHPDAELEALLDTIIERMARAQAPDGYLNTYYLTVEPGKRWMNERAMHETYCAGHLIEAAVAYYETTGKRRFLEIMQRYADHIASVFGPGEGQIHGYPGHEEIELALVKLYRASGEARYLDLARFFIDERGKQPHYFDVEARARGEDPAPFHAQFLDTLYGDYSYFQAHVSVSQQSEAVGHAVRATYLYSGMADVAALDGDDTLPCSLHRVAGCLPAHLAEPDRAAYVRDRRDRRRGEHRGLLHRL